MRKTKNKEKNEQQVKKNKNSEKKEDAQINSKQK